MSIGKIRKRNEMGLTMIMLMECNRYDGIKKICNRGVATLFRTSKINLLLINLTV